MPKPLPPNKPRFPSVLLTLLAASLAACATTSTPPTKPPANPSPPATSTALPSVDYSISAQELIKTWRKQLKVTPTM